MKVLLLLSENPMAQVHNKDGIMQTKKCRIFDDFGSSKSPAIIIITKTF